MKITIIIIIIIIIIKLFCKRNTDIPSLTL